MVRDIASMVNHDHLAHNVFSPQEMPNGDLRNEMQGANPLLDERGQEVAGGRPVSNRMEFNSQITQYMTMQAHFERNPRAKRSVLRRALAFEKRADQLYHSVAAEEEQRALRDAPADADRGALRAQAREKAAAIRDYFLDVYVTRNIFWIMQPARKIDPKKRHTRENVELQKLVDRHNVVVDGESRRFLDRNRRHVTQVWHAANNKLVANKWENLPGMVADYRSRRGGYSETPFPSDVELWKLDHRARSRSFITRLEKSAIRSPYRRRRVKSPKTFRNRSLNDLYSALRAVLKEGRTSPGPDRLRKVRADALALVRRRRAETAPDIKGDELALAGMVTSAVHGSAVLDRRGRLDLHGEAVGGGDMLVVEFPRALVKLSDRRAASDTPIESPSLAKVERLSDLTYGLVTGLSPSYVEIYLPGKDSLRTFSRHEFDLYWHRGKNGPRLLKVGRSGNGTGRVRVVSKEALEHTRTKF